MSTVIIINGKPRSGKDFFVQACTEYLSPYVDNLSTIGLTKKIAYLCGWDGEKTDEWRKKLSDLKAFLTQLNDAPWKSVIREMKQFQLDLEFDDFNPEKAIFFVHCREPKEIQRYVDELNAITVLVRRDKVDNNIGNASDDEVFNFDYDFEVNNNGTKEDILKEVYRFLCWLDKNEKTIYTFQPYKKKQLERKLNEQTD